MASRVTFRVYRRINAGTRQYLGIVAVRLDEPDTERRAFEMARSIWGLGEFRYGSNYEIEVQGID